MFDTVKISEITWFEKLRLLFYRSKWSRYGRVKVMDGKICILS